MQAQGKYTESVSYYRIALEHAHKYKIIKNPDAIHASMANSFAMLKNYEGALESYDNALHINPKNIEVLNIKGLLCRRMLCKSMMKL